MSSVTIEKYTYFQFNKKLGYPVYIRFRETEFDPEISGFLSTMKFDELGGKEAEEVERELGKASSKVRVLTVSEASLLVSKQIAGVRESDKFGPESIVPKKGYSVYRYRGVAMIVYSNVSKEWHMGCYPDFGHVDNESAHKVVMNRFLSWALAPLGVIGFWGTPVDEGVVVQRLTESRGETIYIDVNERRIYSQDGEKRMKFNFSFIKLDRSIQDRAIQMKAEQLMSFLLVHCTYFSNTGHPVFVRQMAQALSRVVQGEIYPNESFKPRQEVHLEK